ncbi:cytochrome P450 78A5-like [Cucumis melo var. makuwa]|uniref:Cytochrome P450 78A5-like n=1 Tax=Cucumis melo var. makuwa TaxID=1194695 RepID=A0A5A7SW79_CUCMM|nr:cytochrome P450 78A5-like [Cucumis melo var. makuwa]
MKLLVLAILTISLLFPFSLLNFLFCSLLAFSLNYWLIPGGFAWRNHHRFSVNLPGPSGWPLLGTLPQMGPLAHRNLAAIAHSFKATRLMSFSMGATRAIISSHPDTAKQILCGSAFSDRPVKQSAKLMMFERAIGFAPNGVYWRNLRRIAANHMFSPRKISDLEGLRREVADEMVAEVSGNMASEGVVRLREVLQKHSLKNIIESVFGSGMEMGRKGELSDMVREGYELIAMFNWEDYFPISFLDFSGVKRRCNELAGRVNVVIGQIVEERKRVNNEFNNDFLTTLLTLPKEDQLSDSDMVAVLWEMIFRGTDTIAILLEWIMARMILHPDIQAKAQDEIDLCVGGNRHVRDSDIPNLPYLQAIVKEVLRLHPPGPLFSWARLAVHDVHVDKILIPAGTTAMVNMWAIAHDPSIWKDPWTFKPERFIENDMSIMGSDLRLAPFGAGRRACPGRALGLATVHLWLANFLHRFRWIPCSSTKSVNLSECLKLSLEMKKPLNCRVVSR